MRIKKMQHKSDILSQQHRERILAQKKEKLFTSLASIHTFAKLIQIAYYDAIKGTSFFSPKIKSKSDQIHKFSEDIIKSLGDAVRLKEEYKDYMEYDHFTELYELLKILCFASTQSIKDLTQAIKNQNYAKDR